MKRVGHVRFAAKVIKAQVAEKKEEHKAVEKKAEGGQRKKSGAGDEEDEAPKKKEVNPLDVLPPTTFDLYSFKTFFVNHKDKRGEAIKFFFDNYDREGYCIYFLSYIKAEGEGTILWQTSNLMNGFLQRIDNFRKHVFAMHAIVGDEPTLEIQGVWLFRGKGIPQEMKDNPQFEYYSLRELSIDNEADKKLITDFWCTKVDETANDLVVRDCKAHK